MCTTEKILQPSSEGDHISDTTTTSSNSATTQHSSKKPQRTITYKELNSHKSVGDCWISIDGRVYDVSRFHKNHPGGSNVIMEYTGMEAGDVFHMFHAPVISHHLRRFLIGRLETEDGTDGGGEKICAPVIALPGKIKPPKVARHDAGESLECTREYRKLRKELWEEGAFVPSYPYFAFKLVLALSFLIVAVGLMALYPSSTVLKYVVAPALVALTMQQSALVAHDTLHNGVVLPRGKNWKRFLLGQLSGGVLMGVSPEMWLKEHNEHHAFTIRPGGDPQFDYLFLWLMSLAEIPYWKRHLPEKNEFLRAIARGFARVMVRVQHLTVVPLALVIGRYNFLAICWSYAVRHGHWADLISMSLHFAWYSMFVSAFYGSPTEKLLFVVINYALNGVLHIQLLLSHFCGPQFSSEEESALGVFQFQLLTTRNVKSCWWSHWFHGGLELQIEHHLFPMLPRHRLRSIRGRVRAICDKHGIDYVEVGFFEGVYDWLVKHPHEAAKAFAAAEFL
eukprot:CAMPEP_0172497356 /NCGR_PEP_ID=MMETSP1066-20121228/98716_1 /TAXON_ID=671091 /ORGANISM="Coscinodiscus wailesii, Strain CCMP2513" /LENGTH=506 /DNA_ID=CAMNT_0013270069 /DNA_START=142 /DNA_END=1662 /DNA_ORIENTATION=-